MGGFSHEVCRSGAEDLVARYLGESQALDLQGVHEWRGTRLWLHPKSAAAEVVVKQVEQAWNGVQQQMAATLLVTKEVARRLKLQDRTGWSQQMVYAPG